MGRRREIRRAAEVTLGTKKMSTVDSKTHSQVGLNPRKTSPTLGNTFVIPLLFTVVFAFAFPPMPSDGPIPPFTPFWPSLVILAGMIGWVYMVISSVPLLCKRSVTSVILGITVVFWIIAFAFELILATFAVSARCE